MPTFHSRPRAGLEGHLAGINLSNLYISSRIDRNVLLKFDSLTIIYSDPVIHFFFMTMHPNEMLGVFFLTYCTNVVSKDV